MDVLRTMPTRKIKVFNKDTVDVGWPYHIRRETYTKIVDRVLTGQSSKENRMGVRSKNF